MKAMGYLTIKELWHYVIHIYQETLRLSVIYFGYKMEGMATGYNGMDKMKIGVTSWKSVPPRHNCLFLFYIIKIILS